MRRVCSSGGWWKEGEQLMNCSHLQIWRGFLLSKLAKKFYAAQEVQNPILPCIESQLLATSETDRWEELKVPKQDRKMYEVTWIELILPQGSWWICQKSASISESMSYGKPKLGCPWEGISCVWQERPANIWQDRLAYSIKKLCYSNGIMMNSVVSKAPRVPSPPPKKPTKKE